MLLHLMPKLANIRLGRKCSGMTNVLAYFDRLSLKSYITFYLSALFLFKSIFYPNFFKVHVIAGLVKFFKSQNKEFCLKLHLHW
jgi:hypothetical protein